MYCGPPNGQVGLPSCQHHTLLWRWEAREAFILPPMPPKHRILYGLSEMSRREGPQRLLMQDIRAFSNIAHRLAS